VGAFEAKTHFNELLKRVSKGETIRITLRGIPVAKLAPSEDGEPKDLKKLVRENPRNPTGNKSGRSHDPGPNR
jgi:prevent-host-death family protein